MKKAGSNIFSLAYTRLGVLNKRKILIRAKRSVPNIKLKMLKNFIHFIFICGFLLIFATQISVQSKEISAGNFEVQKIAKDIYAVIRKEPPSLWFNPNTVFIIGKKDVIVVDSNISSEYTKEVLAQLKKITKKPVRYVINTHWHEDHIIGNHVYRDAFPNVEFIGQKSTLTDLPAIGAANRKGSIENGKGFIELLRSQIAKGKGLAGQNISEEEKLGYSSDINLVESYLAESSNFQIILPTILVEDKLELNDGKRKIEILFLGKAHTAADLVVFLPKEKIVASGDLLVSPIPLIGSTSYPLEYGKTLENLLKLNAKIIIPGHGNVMRDDSYIKLMIRLLDSIKRQVELAVARGETLEQMRKSINLEEFRKAFAGDSQHKSFVFQNYVFLPATAAAYHQLTKKR
jgi:glyoxylase-like metal-dependent hydrolase (beta-lactamase superfamily II)